MRSNDKSEVECEVCKETKARFVCKDVLPGVVPEVLQQLLTARRQTRALLEKETDPLTRSVLNCRQLALKVSANSVYGFTGATVGKLPCLEISESVTGWGREMIEKTKQLVEGKYRKENGYAHDATVIYGDTDSVMVNFGDITLEEAVKLGQEAAASVSESFPRPIRLEFEKIYQPYLLISKKHYAGLKHMSAQDPGYIDAKGIETVRRDNCRLVQCLLQKALDLMLIGRNVEGAIAFVKSVISDLLSDRIDLSFLVISKGLTKSEYKAKQPHVELAKRLAKRDPGSAPRLGDRIPYVIVANSRDSKAFEKSEDPLYALEHGMQIDTEYYLENQLKNPLMRLFEPIMGEAKVKGLFEGEHTRHIKKTSVRRTPDKASTGLMAFVTVKESCVCGKASVAKGKPPVCAQCANRITDVYEEKLAEYRYVESEHSRLWSHCQRCQKSVMNKNICTAIDCPIFYRRRKAQLDLEDAYKALRRFDQLQT